MARPSREEEAKERSFRESLQGSIGGQALGITANQVDQLQNQIAHLKERIKELEDELLVTYRALYRKDNY